MAPGGTLSDYVPFYFTPCSPMLYNIKTGYNGVPKQEAMEEIVLLVASLRKLAEAQKRYCLPTATRTYSLLNSTQILMT